MEWVDLVDFHVSNFLLTLIGVAEFVVVGWVFGVRDFSTLMQHRLEWGVSPLLAAAWRFSGPAILSTIFVTGAVGAIRAPIAPEGWAQALGWAIGVLPMAAFAAIFRLYPLWFPPHPGGARRPRVVERIRLRASRAWGRATGRGAAPRLLRLRSVDAAPGPVRDPPLDARGPTVGVKPLSRLAEAAAV